MYLLKGCYRGDFHGTKDARLLHSCRGESISVAIGRDKGGLLGEKTIASMGDEDQHRWIRRQERMPKGGNSEEGLSDTLLFLERGKTQIGFLVSFREKRETAVEEKGPEGEGNGGEASPIGGDGS